MHAIQDRPVAREGNVVIRPMMYSRYFTITDSSTPRSRLLPERIKKPSKAPNANADGSLIPAFDFSDLFRIRIRILARQ